MFQQSQKRTSVLQTEGFHWCKYFTQRNFFRWFEYKNYWQWCSYQHLRQTRWLRISYCQFPLVELWCPRLPSYGVYISQLVRFARCCTSVSDFHSKTLQKICYDNIGKVPNKGRNFNTQTFRKMYLFVICMISRHWFQTKLLLYIS